MVVLTRKSVDESIRLPIARISFKLMQVFIDK